MSDMTEHDGAAEAAGGTQPAEEARYLDPTAFAPARTPGGFVSLTLGERAWPRVHFYRAFPATRPDSHVCVRDDEGKEIGILESLEGLSPGSAAVVREELDRRYYTPVISRVVAVKVEWGYSYWEVETDHGARRFTVQSSGNNAVQREGPGVVLIDVDGNRFSLPDPARLDRKHLRVLEALL